MKAPNLVPRLIEFNQLLYQQTGYFKNGIVKDRISKVHFFLEKHNGQLSPEDISIVLEPFLFAIDDSVLQFGPICYQFFNFLLRQANAEQFISEKNAQSILGKIIITDIYAKDDFLLMQAECIDTLLRSKVGLLCIHEKDLSLAIFGLFMLLKNIKLKENREKMQRIITEYNHIIFHMDTSNPLLPQKKIHESLFLQTYESVLNDFVENFQDIKLSEMTIYYADIFHIMVCMFNALSSSYNIHEMTTISNSTLDLLNSNTQITKNDSFKYIIQGPVFSIIRKVISLPSFVEFRLISNLILTLFDKYILFSMKFLRELLEKDIFDLIQSPESFEKGSEILSSLTSVPLLFIKCCYPNDKNIFHNLMKAVCEGSKTTQTYYIGTLHILKIIENFCSGFLNYFPKANKSKRSIPISLDNYKIFEISPSEGIKAFIKAKIITNESGSIAQFLKNDKDLNKRSKTKYLSTHILILNAYLNEYDFSNQTFEKAFSEFFSGLKITGSMESYDVLVSTFSKRYAETNTNLSLIPDAIYILTYNVFILHSVFHSLNSAVQISLEEFIIMNKGVNDGNDIPTDILNRIYDFITKSPALFEMDIPMISTYHERSRVFIHKYEKTDSEEFLLSKLLLISSDIVIDFIMYLLRSTSEKRVTSILNKCFIQMFSISARTYHYDNMSKFYGIFVSYCLSGNKYNQANHDFHSNLSNILFQCALKNPSYLDGYWRLIINEGAQHTNMVDSNNSEHIEQIIMVTRFLYRDSFIEFLTAFLELSKNEITKPQPSVTILMKLSNLAHWNKDRPVFLWREIWPRIQEHLSMVGCQKNLVISQTAIDVIRQLIFTYIDMKSQNIFHFQHQFLKPFLNIYDLNPSHKMKLFILECISRIIKEKGSHINSGWDVILQILALSSHEDAESMEGATIVEFIVKEHIGDLAPYIIHLMSVVSSFINSPYVQSKSIDLLDLYTIISNIIPNNYDTWVCLLQNLGLSITNVSESISIKTESIFVDIFAIHSVNSESFPDDLWGYTFESLLYNVYFQIPNMIESRVIRFLELFVERNTSRIFGKISSLIAFLLSCISNRACQSQIMVDFIKGLLCKLIPHSEPPEIDRVFSIIESKSVDLYSNPYFYCLIDFFFENLNPSKDYHHIIINIYEKIHKYHKDINFVYYESSSILLKQYFKVLFKEKNTKVCAELVDESIEQIVKDENRFWVQLMVFFLQTLDNTLVNSLQPKLLSLVCLESKEIRKALIPILETIF